MEEARMKPMDSVSSKFSRIAYKIHPKLGKLYSGHTQFFNMGLVELACLMVANIFIAFFSLYFVGILLAIVLTFTATPITYMLKYLLNKHWVWRK
jgi:hypothetical protein